MTSTQAMFKALMDGQQSMEQKIQRLLDTSNDIYATLTKLKTYTEAGFDTMDDRFDRLECLVDGSGGDSVYQH